jgi:hypothetical protein
MIGKCIKCSTPFRYRYRHRKRLVCPKCLKENLDACKRRARDKRRILPSEERHTGQGGAALMDCEEVAKILKCGPQSVFELERNALAKVRQHPEAKRLWQWWKEEGCPTPSSADADIGRQLLEYHIALSDWWNVHDSIQEDPACKEEAKECLSEIARFFRLLKSLIEQSVTA